MVRKFIPGTEWLYLKIYTGIKTSDLILEDLIKPSAEYFQKNNYISKWFFIRYHDPKPHLRIRFCLSNTEYYNNVLREIHNNLQEFIQSGEISSLIIDTYSREIERYGQSTIEEAETLFYKNSDFTLQCLQYADEEKILFTIFYIDQTLDQLNLSDQQKLNWIEGFNHLFKEEFNADKKLNSQLDKKYREFKPKLMSFIQKDAFSDERQAIASHVEENASVLKSIIQFSENGLLEIYLQSFFQSIFHMNINRLFVSNQRLFEMIIYDYMQRYYKMKCHINSSQAYN
ncbi:thiopeptide-type bacteriocin biosynthesis protein [Chryseobacterium chendengshani]|uniref:thiopeptide-type bacteriocin biosynthesis protein n=1 Tax=Chryseobacterium sp. LJ668 TaxID=2864040 RepID=UPI001C68A9EA|nr:thiopeptide-type bacteriocin biosynthesis protein [Chryseobacterium sp. LJ668]MBW8522217.1 thiopeptide-type bacteriocin biosynthesis protein [Chryseobacterium sp. LJ668]QYK17861.1 thiopeptide-type bacteriocin biosynthesis protein [Chryseobacterium sp. LJ668]